MVVVAVAIVTVSLLLIINRPMFRLLAVLVK